MEEFKVCQAKNFAMAVGVRPTLLKLLKVTAHCCKI